MWRGDTWSVLDGMLSRMGNSYSVSASISLLKGWLFCSGFW